MYPTAPTFPDYETAQAWLAHQKRLHEEFQEPRSVSRVLHFYGGDMSVCGCVLTM